jgi:hypothetical protein
MTLRRERENRVAFLNRLLGFYGISIKDWGGNSYVLQDRDGHRQNVYNLTGIWAAVDALNGGGSDPLDSALLEHLNADIEARE